MGYSKAKLSSRKGRKVKGVKRDDEEVKASEVKEARSSER